MTVQTVPSAAKIRHARLRISAPDSGVRSVMNRRAAYGHQLRAMWNGAIEFAALSRQESAELHAFFERLDGQVDSFGVPIPLGVLSQGNTSPSGTLNTAVVAGSDTADLTGFPTNTVLLRGTLLALGDIDDSNYQVVEVVVDADLDSSGTTTVAPRIRRAIDSGTAVKAGGITMKLNLTGDRLDSIQDAITYGSLAIDVMEAL